MLSIISSIISYNLHDGHESIPLGEEILKNNLNNFVVMDEFNIQLE
jgi:hypothetical protein